MTDHSDDTRRAQRRAKTEDQGDTTSVEQASDAPPPASNAIEQIRDRNARMRAEAARDRQSKRERGRAAHAPVGLDASERMDDILVRTTHAVTVWVRANFKWLQWVVIGTVVGGLGFQGYRYFTLTAAAQTTDAAFLGVDAERGRVVPQTEGQDADEEQAIARLSTAPSFVSAEERATAAEDRYRRAIREQGEKTGGWFARLGLAGLLFEQKKWDESLSLYRAVRASDLAREDLDVRGRALEGMGFCLEAKKDLEGALQAYRELTNMEGAANLSTTGLYHQGRLLLARGDKDKAKELLLKAKERLVDKDKKPEQAERRPTYLAKGVGRLLAEIDPALASGLAEPPNLGDLLKSDPERLQKLLERMQHQTPPAPPAVPAAPVGTVEGDTPAPPAVPAAPVGTVEGDTPAPPAVPAAPTSDSPVKPVSAPTAAPPAAPAEPVSAPANSPESSSSEAESP